MGTHSVKACERLPPPNLLMPDNLIADAHGLVPLAWCWIVPGR